MNQDILKKDGLSIEKLEQLSYRSKLGIRLKKNLHYFDKDTLFTELEGINVSAVHLLLGNMNPIPSLIQSRSLNKR